MSDWKFARVWFAGALLVGALASGCEHSERPRTSLFDEGEQHYERGEYDAALDDYQAFLQRFPRSPLAETARLRVRSINREVQSVMGASETPDPRYLGPRGGPGDDAPPEVDRADAGSDRSSESSGGE